MPFINHKNLGDAQKHTFLTGTITATYPEDLDTSEEYWDTADVLIDEYYYTWEHATIFYHCYNEAQVRDNGAIYDGAKGFTKGDRVVVMCEIVTPEVGSQRQIDNVKIVGHVKGPKKCAYNYVLVRCSLKPLEDLVLDDITVNLHEHCIVFNAVTKKLASIPDPDSAAGLLLSFPCKTNLVKAFLLGVDFLGSTMWEEFEQGATQDTIEVASGTPNWQTDISGDDIRGDIEAKEWWTSYDINGNPVLNLFEDMYLALMTDDEGSSDGSYQKVYDILDGYEDDISTWDSNSSGVVTDKRQYSAPGPEDLDKKYAIGVDGNTLDPATSRNIQIAFGEDEIWMCIVNTYMGMIIEYCDQSSTFVRTPKLYDAIPIPGVIENYEQVASDASLASSMPGGMSSGSTLADIGTALAASITLAGKGDENNLFSWGTLKRINEGFFNRTIHPAIIGSVAMRTTTIPDHEDTETKFLSAINYRYDSIKIWYRYDNWNSTFDYFTYSYGVSITWWFRTATQQMGCEAVFLDTPLGSMWYQPPEWKAFIYYLYALQVGSVLMTARRDKTLNQDFKKICKHSNRVACQIYAVQRVSLTLWANESDIFVKQTVAIEPYLTIPSSLGDDPVSYAKMEDSTYKHFDELTDEELNSLVSDRIFLYTDSEDQTESLRISRNEIEIMAAVDMYSDLYADFGRENPADQVRSPEFEAEIANLIQSVMKDTDEKYAPFYLDMEIL